MRGRTTVAEMVVTLVRAGMRDERILARVTNRFPRSRMTMARIGRMREQNARRPASR